MVCRSCGTEIADKAIVCYRCGTPTAAAAGPVRARGRRRRPWWLLLVIVLALFIWLAYTL